MNERKCPVCGVLARDKDNFCMYCGAKISEVCPHCWKKEGQPNNCPGEKCPD